MEVASPTENGKVWIASKHTNHISYRKLNGSEQRNKSMFELSRKAFASWQEAHEFAVAYRKEQVDKLMRALKNADAQLQKALAMKEPPTS